MLSFAKGKFTLKTANAPTEVDWYFNKATKLYETRKLKAANTFKNFADESAKRIFDQFALKKYTTPPGAFHGLDDPNYKIPLMPFQRQRGVPFILKQNHTYLAHEPGLGKTIQAISAVSAKPGKTWVICPAFLRVNWAREITKWFIYDFPTIGIIQTESTPHEYGQDFLIISDAILEKPQVLKNILAQSPPKFIFIDEGHRFKTPEASRTTALYGGRNGRIKSPGIVYKAEHVSVLSGTPLLKTPIELWTTLYSLAPETIDFMSYHEFGHHFSKSFLVDGRIWVFKGSKNEDELKRRLEPFMQRITKEEVLPELPPKIREMVFVTKYRGQDTLKWDDTVTKEFLKSKHPKPESLGEFARLRRMVGVEKIVPTIQFIKEILDEDPSERIILYAYHRDNVADLAKGLEKFNPRVIMGGVQHLDRVATEDAFQNGDCRLIIGNLRAMGLGLTLTRATRVVFMEYSETPAENEQAEDRAHRIGQKGSVYIQYLVLPNSLDEIYLGMIMEKQFTLEKLGL